MELRYNRYKLPITPERRKRKLNEVSPPPSISSSSSLNSKSLFTPPDATTPRSIRLSNRKTRSLFDGRHSPLKRRREMSLIRYKKNNLVYSKEDSALHSESASTRTLSRLVLTAILKKDSARLASLMSDPRMPLDALTTQFSYMDDRSPLLEAFLSADSAFIIEVLKARSARKEKGAAQDQEPLFHEKKFIIMSEKRDDGGRSDVYRVPIHPIDDMHQLRKFAAPEIHKEDFLLELVRQNIPYSIIESFRPSSLYDDFYSSFSSSSASVIALRHGHCILAMNLARGTNAFPEMTMQIIAHDSTEEFDSDALLYKSSETKPSFLPIHAAAARGSVPILEWYQAQNPNAINLLDDDHWSLLHYAAASENSAALRWLLAKGAKVTFKNKKGQTALHVAVETGRVENVKILVSTIETFDHLSLNSDHLPLADRSSVNWKDDRGRSALLIAAYRKDVSLLRCFTRHPFIDLYSSDEEGRTAMMIASARGSLDCVAYLSEICDYQVDNQQRNSLMHAAINGHSQVVGYLIREDKQQLDSMDTFHNTPLHYACAYGWVEIVKMIVQIDASLLSIVNNIDLNPANIAYRNGHYGILSWLLRAGYDKYVKRDPTTRSNIQQNVMFWSREHMVGFRY